MTDTELMRLALREAQFAAEADEVPVGAVIAREGEVIALGRNMREGEKNSLAHAEIIAIDRACKKLHGWRLQGCDIFVTLEPCPMCAGAIINSRLNRVVFGAYDEKAGSFGSLTDLSILPYNHKPEIIGGVLSDECARVLTDFFIKKRK